MAKACSHLSAVVGCTQLNVCENKYFRRLNFSKHTFDSIPISVATYLKPEPEPRQHSFGMVGIIDQNRCLGDRHVLLQFMEEQHSDQYQTDSTGTPRVEIR